MIYSFKEKSLKINELVKRTLYDELDKAVEFENFNLHELHRYFSSDKKPHLLNKVYSLFREKKFQKEYDKLCNILKEEFHTPYTRFQSIPSIRIQMPGD